MQALFKRKLLLLFGILAVFYSTVLAGVIALVEMYPWDNEYNHLISSLRRDGHTPFVFCDTFVDPSSFDTYWITPDEDLNEDNIAKLYTFVVGGGHLILVPDCRTFIVGPTNRILEFVPWFEELGRPQAYNEYVNDLIPDTIAYFGPGTGTSFIVNFDYLNERLKGIDTLLTGVGISLGFEASGCLNTVGWGGRDCYGTPYDADTAVYDSFAVQILASRFRAGEITVVADLDLFSDTPETYYDDLINYFDNLQFARQLFACNTRADSAALEQADSTLSLRLFGEFTDFNPDSCEWKFRILHVWPPYEFRGHELGARFIAPDLLEIDYPPIYNPVYDTVEVCVMFLPDYDGETVLWDFPVCDTFKFDFSGIAETPTPQAFTISAHPNPFNSSVTITLDAPVGAIHELPLQIEIYDVNGRRVAELIPPSPPLTRGEEERKSPLSKGDLGGLFIWRPDPSLGSGVYLIRIEQSGRLYTKPVVYVK